METSHILTEVPKVFIRAQLIGIVCAYIALLHSVLLASYSICRDKVRGLVAEQSH